MISLLVLSFFSSFHLYPFCKIIFCWLHPAHASFFEFQIYVTISTKTCLDGYLSLLLKEKTFLKNDLALRKSLPKCCLIPTNEFHVQLMQYNIRLSYYALEIEVELSKLSNKLDHSISKHLYSWLYGYIHSNWIWNKLICPDLSSHVVFAVIKVTLFAYFIIWPHFISKYF